jgi:hypothetical protein
MGEKVKRRREKLKTKRRLRRNGSQSKIKISTIIKLHNSEALAPI